MGKNKDLQKMLTEFEKEFGHIKEWEIDRNNQLASIASDGGKATGPKLGRHNVESGHLQNIAKSGGLTTPLKPILQFTKQGVFVKEYESVKSAAKAVNSNNSVIVNHLKGRYNCCWVYLEIQR